MIKKSFLSHTVQVKPRLTGSQVKVKLFCSVNQANHGSLNLLLESSLPPLEYSIWVMWPTLMILWSFFLYFFKLKSSVFNCISIIKQKMLSWREKVIWAWNKTSFCSLRNSGKGLFCWLLEVFYTGQEGALSVSHSEETNGLEETWETYVGAASGAFSWHQSTHTLLLYMDQTGEYGEQILWFFFSHMSTCSENSISIGRFVSSFPCAFKAVVLNLFDSNILTWSHESAFQYDNILFLFGIRIICRNWLWRAYDTQWLGLGLWSRCILYASQQSGNTPSCELK